MRFFMLVFGLVATLSAIYFVVLFWGLGRTLHQFEHPFAQLEKPIVALPWDSHLWATLPAERLTRLTIWIDVYRSKDGSLRALPSPFRPEAQDPLRNDLENDGPILKDAVRPHAERPIILNVVANEDHIDTQVNAELADLKLAKVLVQSEYDNVMSSIKNLQPLWIYGTSASDRVRWNMFASLGLAPAVTFTGDVYVSPLKVRDLNVINAGILHEIRRRSLLLLLGPLTNLDEVRQAQAYMPDAYFVTSSEAFEALPSF